MFTVQETRASALKAKTELDHSLQKGKNIRVKFSTVQSYVKITNLPPFVSVELLESAFRCGNNSSLANFRVSYSIKSVLSFDPNLFFTTVIVVFRKSIT